MSRTTREQLLLQAQALFAQRGFYGVSIAAVADELKLTKQALLHHFGSKEKLYGEVLQRVSDDIESVVKTAANPSATVEVQFQAVFEALLTHSFSKPEQTTLLMRELLDNKRRADNAQTWYLKPFLKRLTSMLGRTEIWQTASEPELLAAVYLLLGSFNYVIISAPTLQAIFGKSTHARFNGLALKQHRALVNATLSRSEATHR